MALVEELAASGGETTRVSYLHSGIFAGINDLLAVSPAAHRLQGGGGADGGRLEPLSRSRAALLWWLLWLSLSATGRALERAASGG